MLKKLIIQNYAIIDAVEIDFSEQLNIITGETGAGKSILMGALSLILGERADTAALPDKTKKCFIEGYFEVNDKKSVIDFLQANDLDVEEELVIRREIAPNGKSRAFVNDTPVNLEQLRNLSSFLVDLHRQFDTMSLGDEQFQREVIDALANHPALLTDLGKSFNEFVHAEKAYQQLSEEKENFIKEFDYNKFLFEELEQANFQPNELEDAEQQLKILSNAEQIKTGLSKAAYILQEGETPMVQQLKSLYQQLSGYGSSFPQLAELLTRIQATQIELADIAGELERLNDQTQYDAAAIERLNDRVTLGYKLQKKHGVNDTAGLLMLQQNLSEKLSLVLNIDDQLQELEKKLQVKKAETLKLAQKVSANRKKQVQGFEQSVNNLLAQVGMPNARLRVEMVSDDKNISRFGIDQIEFLFDANKSGQFKPVGKVASGGELSRLMLCIKSLVAEKVDLATLIFDEIDTGISGEAAKQVGIILKGLSANRQIICITHQPQIAGKASTHFYVYKQVINDKVKTNISILTLEERIDAIAKMLGGEPPTAAAYENAREMIR